MTHATQRQTACTRVCHVRSSMSVRVEGYVRNMRNRDAANTERRGPPHLPRGLRRRSLAARLVGLWGFASHRKRGGLSIVSAVGWPVEVRGSR